MMRKSLWVTVAALVLLPAAVAQAQFQQGDWSLTLTGSGASDVDFDATTLAVSGELGYFFTDQLDVFLRQGVGFAENGDSLFNGNTRVGVDFHFDMGAWQPFVGANIGYIYGDAVNDTFVAGPEGGIKYFVNATTFIFGSVEYQFFFEDDDDVDEQFDDGQWVYALGIGFRF